MDYRAEQEGRQYHPVLPVPVSRGKNLCTIGRNIAFNYIKHEGKIADISTDNMGDRSVESIQTMERCCI